MIEPLQRLSVVVPVYQGERTLRPLVRELAPLTGEQVSPRGIKFRVTEVVLVHDCGPDHSEETMLSLAEEHAFVRTVWLSKNYGQHPATLAGMASSTGAWVVTMDEDGQHDPASIGSLVCGVTIHSYVFGAVLQRGNFVDGFMPISFQITAEQEQRYAHLREIVALIPPQASVTATETEVPHISTRMDAYTLRNDAVDADFLLINRDRIDDATRANLAEVVQHAPYGLLWSEMGLYVFRKGEPTPETSRAFAELGLTGPP